MTVPQTRWGQSWRDLGADVFIYGSEEGARVFAESGTIAIFLSL